MKIFKSMFVLLVLAGFATSAIAEVQNVRVTGDIRARVNYSENLSDLNDDIADSFGIVTQRTRVAVESDLTEGVSALVQLEAYSDWGISGTALGREDESFDVRLSQAYVKLEEMFMGPFDLKLGRQYLNYGRGFLISANEEEYKFDAIKLVGKMGDFTLDLFASQLAETAVVDTDSELIGANLGYVLEDIAVEAYVFGITNKENDVDDEDPMYFGIRSDMSLIPALNLWGELAYEAGTVGPTDLSGMAIDAGAEYVLEDMTWMPSLKLAYTWAQGDKGNDPKESDLFFAPFNYTSYGYVFSPAVSNIHIINARLSVAPMDKLTVALDYYHYAQDEKQIASVGNPDIDNGGVASMTNGTDKTLGNEIDLVASYKYTEDVATQLYAGWFMPGDAYSSPGDDGAFEIRGEIVVNF